MAHNALGSDLRHVLVSLMDSLATAVPQSEGDRISQVVRISGCQLFVGVGHGDTIADALEQIKNTKKVPSKSRRSQMGGKRPFQCGSNIGASGLSRCGWASGSTSIRSLEFRRD
jgi:hypothetical protein